MFIKPELETAFYDFAKEALGLGTVEITEIAPPRKPVVRRGWAADIAVSGFEDGKSCHIRVVICLKTLKIYAKFMFNDDNPSNETLRDLICEIANLIGGRAKVILGEKHGDLRLATPVFVGSNSGTDCKKVMKNPKKEAFWLHFWVAENEISLFGRSV
ncbi:MAG: chemotaxis protein CheX [Helicobacteraceae bacterium]|jgi:CheY-specific phosphatase CheX|nr:chemotaxis protein CheX [Helicobacteraceae bacterium]